MFDAVAPSHVQLSYSNDHTADAFYSDDVMKLQLHLPLILRCHVVVQSANHIEPNVTVLFDDVDMTSRFVRSTTLKPRSQDGGLLTTTDYASELEWNVTLKRQMVDLHASNWTCSAVTSYYPPLVTSSLVYVTRNYATNNLI